MPPLQILSNVNGVWVPRVGGDYTPPVTTPVTPPVTPTPSPTAGWPGDPGDGKLVLGWSLGPNGNLTIPQVRTNPGWTGDSTISIIHNYSGDPNGVSAPMLKAAFDAGFQPSQSFKMQNFTVSQIASGSADSAIDASAEICAAWAPKPIELCFYHEPEDNFPGSNTTEQQNFRASARRIALRFAAAGVNNVCWMPIYMTPYSFQTGSGRDWHNWHPDWKASGGWHDTITQHVFGMDIYNPLPLPVSEPWATAERQNRSFSSLLDEARTKIERPGYPEWDYLVPEFGMSYAAKIPAVPDWLLWCQALVSHCKNNRVKAINYWDNSADLGRFGFSSTSDPDYGYGAGRKLQGWKYVVSQSIRKVLPE